MALAPELCSSWRGLVASYRAGLAVKEGHRCVPALRAAAQNQLSASSWLASLGAGWASVSPPPPDMGQWAAVWWALGAEEQHKWWLSPSLEQ